MTAISTKGITIGILNGNATGEVLDISDITKATAPVVTLNTPLAAAPNAGDVVVFGTSTGFDELNGKTFLVASTPTPTTSDFTLAGIDLTDSEGAIAAGITATLYDSADFINLCLNQLDIGAATVNNIDVGTFCGPASITGQPQLGTLTIGGYVDPNDTGYQEIIKAEADGKPRVIIIEFPADYGYLVGLITIGSVSWDVPLEGGVGWTATASQNSQIRYIAP
jgi:hypothetical protein